MAQKPLVGQGLLIMEASRSHTLDTPHSVELLCTAENLVLAGTSMKFSNVTEENTFVRISSQITLILIHDTVRY
jgi:hypothetical protein